MKHLVGGQETSTVSTEKIIKVVSEMLGDIGGYPNPENPSPPGPWDPYMRRAIARLGWQFGPHPDPWSEIAGHFPEPWTIAALKPQPLPPRIGFMLSLSQDVVDRVMLIHEVASAMGNQAEKQGIIVVGGVISRFVDDWCGSGWRPKWPFPGPPPRWWLNELSGLDLIVMGTQFVHSAKGTDDKSLQDQLQNAGARLTEAGMARM